MAKRGECFALMIRGDSMTPRIQEGDVVIVRKQSDVDSGILLSYSLMDLRLLASKLWNHPTELLLYRLIPRTSLWFTLTRM